MKAIRFNVTVPRYAAGLALGKALKTQLWSGRSCTYVDDVPMPVLPGPQWVRIKTRLGGICGSDLGTIHLHTSPYYSVFTSFPYTFGHENVGVIAETGPGVVGWQPGERVVVEPLLWCEPRGFDELCEYCGRGEINRCKRVNDGDVAPGLFIGACRDTSGSWSPYFVAHQSQLYRVPGELRDESALLVEPFACGLHAALQHPPGDDETVLILGAGTIALATLAALRAVGSRAKIWVSARYPFQAEAARRLGASEVLSGNLYDEIARRTGGAVLKPIVGKQVVTGGVDRVYECVGSDSALDDALRLTRPGGQVVLVGVPSIAKGVDWTSIFAKELEVVAAYTYHHAEQFQGRTLSTFDLAIELMASGKVDLSWMVTHRFTLDEYDKAFKLMGQKRNGGLIKAVFEFD
jgi:threonine dehydrogenase-like Zn-dependent dehydrogenase